MIALASSVTTLQPGDVFATGTPGGVGPITAGDTVTIEIERVGRMSLPVVQGTRGRQSCDSQGQLNMGLVPDSVKPEQLADAATLEELYAQLAKINVGAGWNKPTPSLWPSPRETSCPRIGNMPMPKARSMPPAGLSTPSCRNGGI
ncbi:MAG: fumarylacetoacetate hydrolase family protein [Aliidongia sp.]